MTIPDIKTWAEKRAKEIDFDFWGSTHGSQAADEIQKVLLEAFDKGRESCEDQHTARTVDDKMRITNLEQDRERLAWNLAGCLTYAEGLNLREGHKKEWETPALKAVCDLVNKYNYLERQLEQAHDLTNAAIHDKNLMERQLKEANFTCDCHDWSGWKEMHDYCVALEQRVWEISAENTRLREKLENRDERIKELIGGHKARCKALKEKYEK